MTANEQSSDPASCACSTMRRASRAITRLYEDRMAQTGLTITQFSILWSLVSDPGQPLGRLADDQVMDRSTLFRLLAPLKTRALLEVRAGKGRTQLAFATPAGVAAVQAAMPVWEAVQQAFVGQLGPEVWGRLEDMLAGTVTASSDAALRAS